MHHMSVSGCPHSSNWHSLRGDNLETSVLHLNSQGFLVFFDSAHALASSVFMLT